MGDFHVIAKLAQGTERLRFLITSKRIIVAHGGKRGTGAVAMTTFFGKLSGAFEDLFRSGKESLGRKPSGASPEEILASDRDNFFVNYGDVVSLDVYDRLSSLSFTLLTKNEKFEFFARDEPEVLLAVLRKVLGAKLKVSSA